MRRCAPVALLAALALAGCGGGEERDAVGVPTDPAAAATDPATPTDPAATPAPPAASPDGPVTVPLEDTAGLGLRGEVTLASAGADRTDVGVELAGAEGAAFSASIRDGSCASPGALVHDLGAVEDGSSVLAADAPLQGLLSQQRAFALTAAGDDLVACADLPQRAG